MLKFIPNNPMQSGRLGGEVNVLMENVISSEIKHSAHPKHGARQFLASRVFGVSFKEAQEVSLRNQRWKIVKRCDFLESKKETRDLTESEIQELKDLRKKRKLASME